MNCKGLQLCGRQDFAKDVENGRFGKASGLAWTRGSLDPWDRVCACAQRPPIGMSQGKYGPHGKFFFFLIKKEPAALTKAVPSKPYVSAETLKACALIGLHLLAAEGEAGSSGSQSPEKGDLLRHGCL